MLLSPRFVRRREPFVPRLNADAPTAPVRTYALHLLASPTASTICCAQNRLFESANSTFFIILLNADAAYSSVKRLFYTYTPARQRL